MALEHPDNRGEMQPALAREGLAGAMKAAAGETNSTCGRNDTRKRECTTVKLCEM